MGQAGKRTPTVRFQLLACSENPAQRGTVGCLQEITLSEV